MVSPSSIDLHLLIASTGAKSTTAGNTFCHDIFVPSLNRLASPGCWCLFSEMLGHEDPTKLQLKKSSTGEPESWKPTLEGSDSEHNCQGTCPI